MLGGSCPATFVPEPISNNIFTPTRIKIISIVIRYINMNDVAFPSHEKIAKEAGCQRGAVLECLKIAESFGLFKVVHRGKQWDSNIYFLGDVLKDHRVRWSLRFIFGGLHRAFHKTIELLNKASSFPEKAVNELKRTLLISINVFKKNTSISSYRESRLYSTPFVKKENWLNRQKHLWSDWSIRESDLHYQREERDSMYKSWTKPRQEKELPPVISLNIGKISPSVMNERLVMCNTEVNLTRRLAMFERLRNQVERASVPYIDFMITKTKRKIEHD